MACCYRSTGLFWQPCLMSYYYIQPKLIFWAFYIGFHKWYQVMSDLKSAAIPSPLLSSLMACDRWVGFVWNSLIFLYWKSDGQEHSNIFRVCHASYILNCTFMSLAGHHQGMVFSSTCCSLKLGNSRFANIAWISPTIKYANPNLCKTPGILRVLRSLFPPRLFKTRHVHKIWLLIGILSEYYIQSE